MATQSTIFVAIAAYADPELPRTLRDCIAMARRPDALRFGICWQDDPQTPIDLTPFRNDPRFRFVDRTVQESQGGPWARNLAQSLWRGEPYTLQVDSHMKFEPDWDARLIDMLETLPSRKPILTMNAPAVSLRRRRPASAQLRDGRAHHPRSASGTSRGGWAPWFDFGPPNTQQPGRTRFVNGNFAFSRGMWNVEVPQDPDHYYWGEEFNVTVRATPGATTSSCRARWWPGTCCTATPNRDATGNMATPSCTAAARGAGAAASPYLSAATVMRWDHSALATSAPCMTTRSIPASTSATSARIPMSSRAANPDPVTIHADSEWSRCVTFDEARRLGLVDRGSPP